MYKVVEGFVPALPTDNFVKLARPKRNIKEKHFEDYIASNIVEKRTCNNTKGPFVVFFNESYSPVLYSF
jgi:hypothetical protein